MKRIEMHEVDDLVKLSFEPSSNFCLLSQETYLVALRNQLSDQFAYLLQDKKRPMARVA